MSKVLPLIFVSLLLSCSGTPEQDPAKSKELYDQAIEQIRNDNFDAATELFRKAVELDSTNYDAKTYLFFFTDNPELDNPELHSKSNLQVIPIPDSSIRISNLLEYGQLSDSEAEPTDIIESLKSSIENDPTYFMNYYYFGLELNKVEKYEEAIRQFNKALELEPEHRYSVTERAFSKYQLGRTDEACEDWSKLGGGSSKYHEKYCEYN